MLALAIFRVLRQVFKGSRAIGRICDLLDHEKHPHICHCYYVVAIVIYVTHITVNLAHGLELESGVTAAATGVELVAHIIGN